MVDAVLLKPLPYPDADRLVAIWDWKTSESDRRNVINPGNLNAWRRQSRSFREIAGLFPNQLVVTGAGEGVGVPPPGGAGGLRGPGLESREDRPGGGPQVARRLARRDELTLRTRVGPRDPHASRGAGIRNTRVPARSYSQTNRFARSGGGA